MLIRHRQPIKRLGKSSHNRPHNLGKDAPLGTPRERTFFSTACEEVENGCFLHIHCMRFPR